MLSSVLNSTILCITGSNMYMLRLNMSKEYDLYTWYGHRWEFKDRICEESAEEIVSKSNQVFIKVK